MSHLPVSKRWAFLLIIPILISSACGALPGVPSGPQPESQTQEVTVESDVTYGAGSFYLPDPGAGLADLSGYTATLTVSFDGTRAGKPEKWSKTYVMLASKEPAARQLTIEKTGDLADTGTVFMVEMNGVEDEKIGEGSCTAKQKPDGSSLGDRFEPAGFLNFVIGAEAARSETVNDVAADHYTFDQHALGEDGITEANGELWLATEGGYIVKYLLTRKAKAAYFGEGVEGTLTLDYELTDADKPANIGLPEDCPPGKVGAPRLSEASDVLDTPGTLTYHTASSVKDAVAFYREELPKLGWKLQGEAIVTEDAAFAIYKMGNQVLSLAITAEHNITTVRLILQAAPK